MGRHFPIPEGPADIRSLWHTAAPLVDGTRPPWLGPDDDDDFRLSGTVSLAGLDDAERAAAMHEFNELEIVRLVVDEDPTDHDRHHLYVRRPPIEPVWSIGIRRGASPWALAAPADAAAALTAADVTDVPASSVADPFLMHRDGCWQMFFEVVNWRTWKGEIGLATSSDGLRWRYERIVLTEPFHLSYPFVFEADGEIWMIPETSQAGAVRLYRAARFPADWEHAADLLTGLPFADSTLLQHDGRWWLFTETSGDRNDTLRLFRADALHGPWAEHPASPLVRGDAVHARPAGPVFSVDGRLVRLAQNCGPAYGTDVRGIEIMRLTPTVYEERLLDGPPLAGPGQAAWSAGGIHHLDPHRLEDGSWRAAVDGWRMEG